MQGEERKMKSHSRCPSDPGIPNSNAATNDGKQLNLMYCIQSLYVLVCLCYL